jgi:signal transduction histidine kinase
MNARARKESQRNANVKREVLVRSDDRQGVSARAKPLAGASERANEQLKRLFEISKRLARFESVAQTVPEVLALLSQSLPVRIAILIIEHEGNSKTFTRAVTWHAEDVTAPELQAATDHAKTAYAYLARGASEIEQEPGEARLPSTPPPSVRRRSGAVLLPLVVEKGQIFGALQLEVAVDIDETDLAFLCAVVNQFAVALDRAAMVESRQAAAKAARITAEFLSETSAALFSSLDYQTTIAAVVRAAIPPLADICFIDELLDDGRIERVAVVLGASVNQGFAKRIRDCAPRLDSKTPQAQVLRSGESVLLERVEGDADSRIRADILREVGVQSSITVPLAARGRTFGALTFVVTELGRRYSLEELALAEEIGRRAAIAIDNAKHYEKAQREVQARQDLLAIVSHDLRNPLNAILLSAQLFVGTEPIDEAGRRKGADVILRCAHRMDRIIADLLDIASIEAGGVTVKVERQPFAPLVREAVETQRSAAVNRSLRLEAELKFETTQIDCDRGRILQVLGNLIGNAIKFTPRGGAVTVRSEQRGDEILTSVEDTGPGIDAGEVAHVFDRYWQTKKTAHLGTGLGLSICKGLVEAHGGLIGVESRLGHTTFFFTIPMRRGAP